MRTLKLHFPDDALVWCKKSAVYTQLKLYLLFLHLTDPKSPFLGYLENLISMGRGVPEDMTVVSVIIGTRLRGRE